MKDQEDAMKKDPATGSESESADREERAEKKETGEGGDAPPQKEEVSPASEEGSTDTIGKDTETDRPSAYSPEDYAPSKEGEAGLLRKFIDPDTKEEVTLDFRILKEVPYLDTYYNETFLYLIPRDPKSIYAIWEVGEGTRNELRKRFGDDFFKNNRLILRVYQVTGVDFNGFNANEVIEIDDWLDDKISYWISVKGGNDYIAELGYRAKGTQYFEKVARSNSVYTPKGFVEKMQRYAEWSSIQVDPNNVEVKVKPEEWRFNLYHYWKRRTHHAPEEKGYWALVLHQHLPWVRHPEYDVSLEEQWFFEAVVSVYTQLINLMWKLERDKIDFRFTVSLTPSLMSMMMDPLLKTRVARHIDELIALATRERDNSVGAPYHNTVQQILHRFWIAKQVFDAYEGDLTRAYRDFQNMGKIEVITCPATHMILPLYKHFKEVVRAQIQIACRQYQRVMGRWPRGIWLPENAFTPGIDEFLAKEGIKWALINSNGVMEGDTASFYGTNAPVISPNGVAFFPIDPETRAQVWSRECGYPGHPNYKEWYRDLGYEADWDYLPEYFRTANVRRNTGLKYYRITKKGSDLGNKDYYNPLWAEGTVNEQAEQFVYYRGLQVNHAWNTQGGHKPCITSAYDAELFGHWWEEGPFWLEQVFRKMCCDQVEVRPVTPSEYLAEHPHHQKMMPGASSWGKKDYFQTWVDDRPYQPNAWVYRHIYRLCGKMTDLATKHVNETNPIVIRALNQAARELFLAVASDWGFLIETGQAVRYSEIQIITHIDRTKELLRQIEANDINLTYLCTLESADCIFAYQDMDYRVFCREPGPAKT